MHSSVEKWARAIQHRGASITDKETKLFMLVGVEYAGWFKRGTYDPKHVLYYFAYLFEDQKKNRGTSLHQNIKKIKLGDPVNIGGVTLKMIAAVLNCTLAEYKEERDASIDCENYPDFKVMG